MLFKSIFAYNNASQIKGYNLEQMIWYFTVGALIFALTWNFVDTRLSQKILSGDLAVDLLRPVSFFMLEFGNALAGKFVAFLVEFLPGLIIYSMIIFPSFISIASFFKFLLLVFFSFLLFFLTNFIFGLMAFYINSISSLERLKTLTIYLTGGVFIPLEFFPDWALNIINFLPFKYIFYWPIQFFLNREFSHGLWPFFQVLGVQLCWILALFILAKIIWTSAIKKFYAAGG